MHHQPRQAHSERLCRICAPMQRGHACRAHGRTACTQAEPHAPRKLIGGRWAHARGLRKACCISAVAADVAAPKTGAPAAAACVDGCSLQMDSCTLQPAVDRGAAGIESPKVAATRIAAWAAPPRGACAGEDRGVPPTLLRSHREVRVKYTVDCAAPSTNYKSRSVHPICTVSVCVTAHAILEPLPALQPL